jgi:hypothetical protein
MSSLIDPNLTPAGDPDLNGRAARDTRRRRAAEVGAVRATVDSGSEEVQSDLKRVKGLLS